MKKVLVIDTSVLCVWLKVSGKDLSRNKVAVPEGAAGTPPFWSDAQSKSEILKLIINNYKLRTLCTNKLKVGSFDMLHKNLLHYA